jgi:hypothetical protein
MAYLMYGGACRLCFSLLIEENACNIIEMGWKTFGIVRMKINE